MLYKLDNLEMIDTVDLSFRCIHLAQTGKETFTIHRKPAKLDENVLRSMHAPAVPRQMTSESARGIAGFQP
jgi:hypothetical protein